MKTLFRGESMTIPFFDAHCDTITQIAERQQPLYDNDCCVSIRRAANLSPYAQCFAVFTDIKREKDVHGYFRLAYNAFLDELNVNSKTVSLCKSAEDIRAATASGKIAAMLSVEEASLIGGVGIERAYAMGVRMVGLMWNHPNELGHPWKTPELGLTALGKAYVRGCQRLGIAVDLAHASEACFWDAAAIAAKPIIVSHANAYAVREHGRNLKDDQISYLIRTGGVMGITLYANHLADGSCGIDAVLRHTDHVLSLGGENCLAIGGDMDGSSELPEGITGVDGVELIYEEMLRHGYNEELCRRIFYDNLLIYFERALEVSE